MGTFLWHDYWVSVGPLIQHYGDRILYDSAVQNNARVAEVIDDGRWNWPIANSADLLDIKNRCVNYHIDTTREDIISWFFFFFFFFWINKNLLPKGKPKNQETKREQTDHRRPEQRKTDSTSPKNKGNRQ